MLCTLIFFLLLPDSIHLEHLWKSLTTLCLFSFWFAVCTSLWGHLCVFVRSWKNEEALRLNSCWQLFTRNYLIHREVSEEGKTSGTQTMLQYYRAATLDHWGNHQMRPGWSNLMVIVVQHVDWWSLQRPSFLSSLLTIMITVIMNSHLGFFERFFFKL